MKAIFFVILLLLLLITLVADPAPQQLEVFDILLIVLPAFVGTLSLCATMPYTEQKTDASIVLALLLYLSYLFISALIGVIEGIPISSVLRSVGPYINFFPLLFIAFLPTRVLSQHQFLIILLIVGILQGGYNIYLYLMHGHTGTALDVLKTRITFFDPRTTLPLVLSVAVLPLFYLVVPLRNKYLVKMTAILLLLFGVIASLITLTRAILISIFFGWAVFTSIYLMQQRIINGKPFSAILRNFLRYLPLILLITIILMQIPIIQLIAKGLIARFHNVTSHQDFSNGRIYDEWIPALTTWMNSGWINILFGIGAGKSFMVLSGEERTYIHNLIIYSLVYGGFYGLFCCFCLYFSIFKTLYNRAIQTQQIIYLVFASLLASIFFYSQLFAVHKGLAFNAMLFYIIALALHPPSETVNCK